MLGQHAAEFLVLGFFVFSLVAVVAEILIKEPRALLDILTGSDEMARPNRQVEVRSAVIHAFPAPRAADAPAFRKAA